MIKKINAILIPMLALCGCTREVYLQEVPCVDCQPQIEEPCPELEPQTVVYQVYEAPMVQPCPCTCAYQTCCQTCCSVSCQTTYQTQYMTYTY